MDRWTDADADADTFTAVGSGSARLRSATYNSESLCRSHQYQYERAFGQAYAEENREDERPERKVHVRDREWAAFLFRQDAEGRGAPEEGPIAGRWMMMYSLPGHHLAMLFDFAQSIDWDDLFHRSDTRVWPQRWSHTRAGNDDFELFPLLHLQFWSSAADLRAQSEGSPD